MPKKILELCLSPDLGGLELCVVDYFNSFSSKGETYICVTPGSKLDKYCDNKDKIQIKRNKFFPFIPALALAKFIDAKGIDTIHFHWTRDITTVVLAKIFSRKKPKIMQSRHMTMTRYKDDFYHNWLYKNIDTIHAVTHQVQEQLIKYIPKKVLPKIEMVYLGVSENLVAEKIVKQLSLEYTLADSFVVGIIGRIEEAKGQFLVIDAISMLKDLDIKLLIVGDSMDKEYLASLESKIKKLGIEDKVIFTGFTKEVQAHIKLCDVTVLATPKETFGLVVIESMVNSVPVIATAKGGPLEIIEDKVDGLYFDRSAKMLEEKIKLLYEDKEYKNRLSTNAYKKVKNSFDKEKQMNKMYEVIDES